MQAYQYAQVRSHGGLVATPPIIANGPIGHPPVRGPVAIGAPPHQPGPVTAPPTPTHFHVAGTTVPMPTAFPTLAAALGFVQAHFPAHGTVTISS